MVSVHDVAKYIVRQQPVSGLKLQKLVYYVQAWSIIWEDKPLFSDAFQAWSDGPVCKSLYAHHHGQCMVHEASLPEGDAACVPKMQAGTIDIVLKYYGRHSGETLRAMAQAEAPWQQARARAGAAADDYCEEEISHFDMVEFYVTTAPESA